ncbi:hypothetical protein H5410_027219 [Solanum commersonii]|uniref:Uncharacterized protein n=1 Tax=Solanum commersonii TaxID=4109 RepID=A0A9J5Z1D3_SOLCO|nr:hypothetical protein H5410_027219 [Solanum commersonii]
MLTLYHSQYLWSTQPSLVFDSLFFQYTLKHIPMWINSSYLYQIMLSRCIFKLHVGTRFPNYISLQLEHSAIACDIG